MRHAAGARWEELDGSAPPLPRMAQAASIPGDAALQHRRHGALQAWRKLIAQPRGAGPIDRRRKIKGAGWREGYSSIAPLILRRCSRKVWRGSLERCSR